MLLKQLAITGFKSFAERANLVFDRGITAIVGPNGSGKSNLVDAIRWVLGEQSKKSLRGRKGEDIIFAGAKKKSPLSLAQVSLTLEHIPAKLDFQKNGKARPLNFSEVTIKRTLSRDGRGEYFLNKSKVRLKDVALIAADSGFGQKNYIIGQGMIERVIALGPQEKKDLLSEASGVRPLEFKKNEAEKKLAATLNNLNQVRALISEIEPHLGRLKRQAALAGRREKIKNELKQLQKAWYSEKLAKNRETSRQVFEQKQKQAEKRKILENKIKNLQTSVRQNEDEQIKIRKIWINLREEETVLLNEKNVCQEKIATLRGQIKACKAQSGNDWIAQNRKEISRLAAEIQNIAAADGEMEKEGQKQAKLQDQTEKTLSETRKKIIALEKKRLNPLKFSDFALELQVLLKEQEIFVDTLKNALNPEEIRKRAKYIYALLKNILTNISQPVKSHLNQNYLREMEKLKKQEKEMEKASDQIKITIRSQTEKISFLRYQKETLRNKIVFLRSKAASQEKKPLNLNQGREKLASEEKSLAGLREKIAVFAQEIQKIEKTEQEKKDAVFNLDRDLRKRKQDLMILDQEANKLDFSENAILTQKQALLVEIKQEFGEAFGHLDLKVKSKTLNPEAESKIQKLKIKLLASNNIDPETIKEYEQTNSRYQFLRKEADDLEKASESLDRLISRLNNIIQKRFNSSFQKINTSFREYFRAIFRGGKASLALDSEEGMIIQVSPPGKRLSDVAALSGGEKALTGLALIFSIISLTQPPFCVLDEVDAALDEANSRRFARILKTLSKKTQFLAITHNRETMQAADVIYGLTMSERGVSRLLSMKMGK